MSGVAGMGTAVAAEPVAGDPTITIAVTDDLGGQPVITFERVYAGVSPSGTPVYVYAPVGWQSPAGVVGIDPNADPDPTDADTPCGGDVADYTMTQAQLTSLGNELANHILAIDEAHYGEVGDAGASDDALVVLAYNAFDEKFYDCSVTTYTAGYFAPEFITEYGMNAMVVDSFDWANRLGDQTGNDNGQSYLYEGVLAHELEHLLMNYSDPGELSWVDEGLADFAAFLNGYPVAGSHLTYQQVFHRETSLTRWGGGLENYGASYMFFQYLWEQAGGNGDGTFTPDGSYDGAGGDLLIKLIFQNEANGMEGVQAAIDQFNAQTGGDLRSAAELFKDWSLAVYLDDENSDIFDVKAVDLGMDSGGYTIDVANDIFWKRRGQYTGSTPEGRFAHAPNVPAQSALPFGTSYESFRNPGKTFNLTFDGAPTTRVAPHSEPTHWYAGYESLSDHVLDVDSAVAGGDVLDFWSWYFIEDGWDFGFVEALVGGEWQTVPVQDVATGATVTTDEDPHGNNEEGNGLTGTSGGTYFVDAPEYLHLTATLPAGTTDVRFRYSTDAAYLDTGWFVDDVTIDGAPVTLTSPAEQWFLTDGTQVNDWSVQLVSTCDLTPGSTITGESLIDGYYVYRLSGPTISQSFTRCSSQERFTVVISNLPSGDLDVLDAPYQFRVTNTGAKGQK